MKILYTSGYSVEVLSRDIDFKEGVNFYRSPICRRFSPRSSAPVLTSETVLVEFRFGAENFFRVTSRFRPLYSVPL